MRGLNAHVTLQKLEVFCTVAELRSVTRAADYLCITQPVVTSHIRSMEDKLGAKLIRREGRGIVLTPTGLKVLEWAQDVVRRTLEMEREIGSATPFGTDKVVIGASMSVGTYQLPGLICDFQTEHPDGQVELSISNPKIALEDARTGECDMAVVVLSPEQRLDGLAVHALWNEPLLLVSAPRSKWVGQTATREQISQLPFISTTSGRVMKHLEESLLRTSGIASRRIVLALGHPEAQKTAVLRDFGVCLLFRSAVADELERGTLRSVETPEFGMSVPIYLAHRKDKNFSPFQLRFKEHMESANP